MDYKIVNIRTSVDDDPEVSILIIYTGGTVGMSYDEDGSLAPFNFGKVLEHIPEMSSLELKLTVISFPVPLDSSNINVQDWKDLGRIVYDNYDQYDGFVILHGTDTMAYTASALSYMLTNLSKPVIFTGAQIPIGQIRSDARENLITALEIASEHDENGPVVREVCIYFNFMLLRGNRAQKVRSSTFAAFESENYPVLAESGIMIEYFRTHFLPEQHKSLRLRDKFDSNVAIMKIFPGMTAEIVTSILSTPNLKGVVLETYGSGNTCNQAWFLRRLQDAVKGGIVLFNVSQCSGGEVIQGRYETSKKLSEIGVVSGGDITTEAAITKLMFLLGNEEKLQKVRDKLAIPINGEMDG
ncbi:MAG: asparaginase [Cyclobacteriaceae bacterium]